MKAYWKEALFLLVVMFLSVLFIRRFTAGDTLAEYEEKKNIVEEVQDAPENAPEEAPKETSAETPDETPEEASSDTTESIPEEESAKTPETVAEEAPAKTPDLTVIADGFSYSEIPDDIFARMQGKSYPADCTVARSDLRYVRVLYTDFHGVTCQGELVCNQSIAQDLAEIFYELYLASYPIESIRLIDDYNADDDISVAADNTSCFCYRVVDGTTKLSKHAKGLAIDVNPLYNPYVKFSSDGTPYTKLPVCAPYIDRSDAVDNPYRIDADDLCYQAFRRHGFTWGGAWNSSRDYQHFEK